MNIEQVPSPSYVYRATFVQPGDGDTFILEIDMGMKAYRRETIRLFQFDSPEKHPRKKGRSKVSLVQEKLAAELAQEFTTNALITATQILVRTYKDRQTFNRYLAEVWYKDNESMTWCYLAEELQKAGHSKKAFFERWGP